jgi:hypothetical protein
MDLLGGKVANVYEVNEFVTSFLDVNLWASILFFAFGRILLLFQLT